MVTGRHHFETFYKWLIENDAIDDPRIIEEGTNYVSKKYPFSIAICWIQKITFQISVLMKVSINVVIVLMAGSMVFKIASMPGTFVSNTWFK